MELLTKTDVEMIVEDKIYELIKENVEVVISREHCYDLPNDQMKLEIEIWYGNEKIDSGFVAV